ncbi:MAG TPA: cyclic nucleotide-binding domain-containing protein [Anaerolineales bacterium]|nr:cyclic nucleotide-binding domain-containing protein [Anaerolineales bacterium]
MDLIPILRSVELFDGLTPEELGAVSRLCQERSFRAGEVITAQGEPGQELFIVCEGFVEVVLSRAQNDPTPRAMVNLGRGQIFGEMALVDYGPRSATVRAVTDGTVVQALRRQEFNRLCETNHHLGFIVMRNMASDLSFKVRHHHLAGR